MTHGDIIAYCLSKPGAFLSPPFGPDSAVPVCMIIRINEEG